MKTSKYFSDNIILLFAACVILSFLSQLLKATIVVNIIYVFSMLMVFLCYVLSERIDKIIVLLILLVGLSAIVRGFVVNSDFFTHIVITICIFICIDVSASVKISYATYKTIAKLFLWTTLITLVLYYLGPLRRSYFKWTDSICLNFPNPNAAGLWLTCIFVLLFYSSFLFTRGKRLLYMAAALGLLPIVIATKSRNSFFACLLFVLCLVLIKVFKVQKVPNWVLAVVACLPLIVFFFYTLVIVKNMAFWEDLLTWISFDKSVDSREAIWLRVLRNFGNCFLVGNYQRYYNSQMHNSLITIFCRFGAPVTALVCVLLYRVLKNLQENSSLYAALSLGTILFTGCFEASVFVGIAGMYLMLLLIPACASAERE